MNNTEERQSSTFTVQYSDTLVNGLSVTLPPEDAGEYVVSSIDEFKERQDSNTFIEVKVSNQKIDSTELVESFLSQNGKEYEIHRIFENDTVENSPKYITSFLVVR